MKADNDKTEFIIFGTCQMLRDTPGDVKVSCIASTITCSNQALNLGVIFFLQELDFPIPYA